MGYSKKFLLLSWLFFRTCCPSALFRRCVVVGARLSHTAAKGRCQTDGTDLCADRWGFGGADESGRISRDHPNPTAAADGGGGGSGGIRGGGGEICWKMLLKKQVHASNKKNLFRLNITPIKTYLSIFFTMRFE